MHIFSSPCIQYITMWANTACHWKPNLCYFFVQHLRHHVQSKRAVAPHRCLNISLNSSDAFILVLNYLNATFKAISHCSCRKWARAVSRLSANTVQSNWQCAIWVKNKKIAILPLKIEPFLSKVNSAKVGSFYSEFSADKSFQHLNASDHITLLK